MPVQPRKNFSPIASDLYIPRISPFVYSFLEKVWFAFVNKAVSLNFSNDEYCFEHSVFEVLQGDYLLITVSSSQFILKELADKSHPESFKKFIQNTRPIPLQDPLNGSACAIRNAIIDRSKGKIFISADRFEESIILVIEDDGVGMSVDFDFEMRTTIVHTSATYTVLSDYTSFSLIDKLIR